MERVTITLPKELRERAERYATDQGMSLSQLVQEGLALALEPEEKPLPLGEEVFIEEGVGYPGESDHPERTKEG